MGKGKGIDRRQFLGRSSKAAVAAGVALTAAPSMNVLGANEKILCGIVGPGGRGRHLMQRVMKVPGVELVAVADIYNGWRDRAVRMAEGKTSLEVKAYDHYKKILDDKRLNAIVLATPEHAHAHQLVDACDAGKDVYCEKPMIHRWQEGKGIVDEPSLD